jgi:hypothetical protein
MEARMAAQPGFHAGMFVSPIVVHDQMQIEAGRNLGVDCLEEPKKFLMPMAGHAVADDLAVEHAEGREQGGRAVPLVVVGLRPAAAPLQREAWLRAIEGLDLALLVDAQHQRLVRRIQIQSDDVGQLLEEVFVAAQLEGLDPMRLEVVTLPDSLDGGLAEPLGPRQRACAPVRRRGGRGVQCGVNDRADLLHRHPRRAAGPRRILFQPRDAQGQKPFAPQLHRRSGDLQGRGDVLAGDFVGGHRDDLRPDHFPMREASSPGPGIQRGTLVGRQDNGCGGPAHAREHSEGRTISHVIYESLQ